MNYPNNTAEDSEITNNNLDTFGMHLGHYKKIDSSVIGNRMLVPPSQEML